MSDLLSDLRSPTSLLAMMRLPGIGVRTVRKIADSEDASLLSDISESDLDSAYETARVLVRTHEDAGVNVIGLYDKAYSPLLATLPDAPVVLFARGNITLLKNPPMVAVVGTRSPTLFGQSATDVLTRYIAQAGFGICSGLALGVDGIAHRAALEEGVPTIAVLGGGLDNVTPPAHRALARDIVQVGGLLLSEQPFGVYPTGPTLAQRNRIQTGLSCGVLVGQTDIKSGTMYTANYAVTQALPMFCPLPPEQDVVPSATKGLHALLTTPGKDLPDTLVAFKGSRKICNELGNQPVAAPVNRETVADMIAVFEMRARANALTFE